LTWMYFSVIVELIYENCFSIIILPNYIAKWQFKVSGKCTALSINMT